MKKILVSIVLFAMTTGSSLAYNDNLNAEQYINVLNTSIGEMKDEIEPKEEATLMNILVNGGIKEGYIKPSINNDVKLKNCLIGLIDNMEDTKISNSILEKKHSELMSQMSELVTLLDDTISCRMEILNSDSTSFKKAKDLLTKDESKVQLVNDKIDQVNLTYETINSMIKIK